MRFFFYINFAVLKTTEPSEEDLQRIRDNLFDLDRNLGAYPYQNLKHWNCLISNISGKYLIWKYFLYSIATTIVINYYLYFCNHHVKYFTKNIL